MWAFMKSYSRLSAHFGHEMGHAFVDVTREHCSLVSEGKPLSSDAHIFEMLLGVLTDFINTVSGKAEVPAASRIVNVAKLACLLCLLHWTAQIPHFETTKHRVSEAALRFFGELCKAIIFDSGEERVWALLQDPNRLTEDECCLAQSLDCFSDIELPELLTWGTGCEFRKAILQAHCNDVPTMYTQE